MTHHAIEYRPNPLRQGSRSRRGDQVDREFIGGLLDILGDTRLLLVAQKSGTTLTDRSRSARVLTWSEAVSGFDTPPAERGSGYAVTLNGIDEEGDIPDAPDLSFGDGVSDQPFSVFALAQIKAGASNQQLLSKYDVTTAATKREWRFYVDSLEQPALALYDESAAARIGRKDTAALAADTWFLLAATYDGSGASTGIRLYKDGARVDDTSDDSGAYTAMENTASLLRLGFQQGAAAGEEFLKGKIALCGLTAKALSQNEVWALKEAVDGYYGLSL